MGLLQPDKPAQVGESARQTVTSVQPLDLLRGA